LLSIDTNTYLTSLSGAFLLDQTTPQTVINGIPNFSAGLRGSLYDNAETPVLSINPNNRTLNGTDGTTYFEWNTNGAVDVLKDFYFGGTGAQNMRYTQSAQRFDFTAYTSIGDLTNKSIDPYNRLLYKSDGSTASFDWEGVKLPTLTSNGFVKTSGSDGSLSIDTNTYLTSVTAHDLLSSTHGDTLADSVASGDIMYGNSTPKWARLAKGADGKYLKLVSGLPSWEDVPNPDLTLRS